MTLEQAIEYAAERLPEWSTIRIHVSEGEAWVELEHVDDIEPTSDDEFSDPAVDSVAERVRLAVQYALELEKH